MYMFSSYTIIVLVFGIVSLSVLLYIYMIRKNLIKGIYTASCIVIWIISLMLIAVSIANTFIKRPFNDTTVIAIFCSVLVGYVLVITFAAIMFAKLNLKLNSFKK